MWIHFYHLAAWSLETKLGWPVCSCCEASAKATIAQVPDSILWLMISLHDSIHIHHFVRRFPWVLGIPHWDVQYQVCSKVVTRPSRGSFCLLTATAFEDPISPKSPAATTFSPKSPAAKLPTDPPEHLARALFKKLGRLCSGGYTPTKQAREVKQSNTSGLWSNQIN